LRPKPVNNLKRQLSADAEAALHRPREIMGKLKLTVNEEKTRICKVPEGEFDFLGFTFGRMYSPTTGQARLALRPSKKTIQRMVETVHALTVRARTWQETTELGGIDDADERLPGDHAAESTAHLGSDRHVDVFAAEHHNRITGHATIGAPHGASGRLWVEASFHLPESRLRRGHWVFPDTG
jgi:hypothetical protein